MADVYKIAVNLAMQSNAPSFLAALSKQLHVAHVKVEELEGGLKRLSRIKLAVGGGLAIAGGTAMINGLKTMVEHAKELSHELATLKTFNLKDVDIRRADVAARQTTKMVPGTTEAGNLRLFGETWSLLGTNESLKAMAPLAQAGQALGGITGNYEAAEKSMYDLLKSADLMGKLVDEKTKLLDLNKLLSYIDVGMKVAAATHGKVNPQTMYGMAQQGGAAFSALSDEGLMGMFMVAQGMGGMRAGTAATSLYSQMVGGKMTAQTAAEAKKLGIIKDYKSDHGHIVISAEDLNTAFGKAIHTDPMKAAKILEDLMRSQGFGTLDQQTAELFKVLGRQTTQRLMSDFIKNLPAMIAEKGRLEGVQGAADQTKTRNADDMITAEHNLQVAWENLMQAVAGPNAQPAIQVMNSLTSAINWMTDVVRKTDPKVLVAVAQGLGVLGAAMTGAGAAALVAALGPVGWVAAGVVVLAAAIAKFKPEAMSSFTSSVSGFVTAISEGSWQKALKAYIDYWIGIVKLLIPEQMLAVMPKFIDEIKSWPARLLEAIKSMGSALVAAIGAELKSLVGRLKSMLSFGLIKSSFEGGDFGGGGLIKASYGGAANDNLGGGIVNQNGGVINIVAGGGNLGGLGGGESGGFGGGGLIRASFGGRGGRGGGGGGFNDTSGGGGLGNFSADSMSRGMRAMDILVGKGWTKEAAASMVSQFMEESMIHPNPKGWADGGTAHGMAQWRFERFAALKAYAAKMGKPWTDFDTQVGFADAEARARYGGNAWAQTHNLYQGGVYGKHYEGYGTNTFGDRLANSRSLLRAYGNRAPAPTAGPPPGRKDQHHHFRLELDGKQIEARITHHQTDRGMFPTAVGGVDTHGSFGSPGTPHLTAA